MKSERHGWMAGIAALLLVSSACGRSEPTTEPVQHSDATITTTIQAKYFGDSVVKGHEIDVDTDDGIVKLSGTVESEAARTKAAALAQGVEGVTRVENQLRVEAPRAAEA